MLILCQINKLLTLMKITSPVLMVFFLAFTPFNDCLADISKHLTTITDAKATKRVNPKYPPFMAKSKIEGWAKVSYVVEIDGSVSNIIITDSSGYESFENETIKALKHWEFTPAQENGEAIQQCHNEIKMDFSIGDKKGGVSVKFLSKYERVQEALLAKNFNSVRKQLIELKNYKQQRRKTYHKKVMRN